MVLRALVGALLLAALLFSTRANAQNMPLLDGDAPLPHMVPVKAASSPPRAVFADDLDAPLPVLLFALQDAPLLPPVARFVGRRLCDRFDALLDAPLPPVLGDWEDAPLPLDSACCRD